MEQYRDIVPAIADAMQVQSVILNTIAVCVQEYAVRLKDQQKALLEYQQKQEQKEKQRDQALEQWKQQLEGKQGRQEQSLRDQIRQQEQHIQRVESERNMAWDYSNRLMIHLAQHKILPPAPTLESSGPILATVTPSNTPYIDRPVAPPGAGSLTLPHMFPLEPSSATELPPIPISRVPGTSVTAALAVARSAKFTEFYAYEADGNRNLHKRKQQKGLKEAKEPKKSKKAQKVTSKPEHTERLQQLQGDK